MRSPRRGYLSRRMEDYVERSTFYVLSAISFYLFCSAGTTFLFNRRLNCEEEKSSEKVRPEGRCPYGNTLPAPTGGECRGGKLRSSRGMGTGTETPSQVEMGTLKQNVCFAESDRLLRRGARGLCSRNRSPSARGGGRTEFSREASTRRKAKETLCRTRGECSTKIVWVTPARIGKR